MSSFVTHNRTNKSGQDFLSDVAKIVPNILFYVLNHMLKGSSPTGEIQFGPDVAFKSHYLIVKNHVL